MRSFYKSSLILFFVILISLGVSFLMFRKPNEEAAGPPVRYNAYAEYDKPGQAELLGYLETGDKRRLEAAERRFIESEEKIEKIYGFFQPNPWVPYVQYLKGEYDGPDLISEILPTKNEVVSFLKNPDPYKRHRIYYCIRPKRAQDDRMEKIDEITCVKKGSVGADIGCGFGYHVFYFSKIVGNNGRVYAIDIDERRTEYIKKRARSKGIENIITVKSETRNICMPQDSLDWAFMFDVYHCVVSSVEKENSEEYFDSNIKPWLESIRSALKPGARIAICDCRRKNPGVTSQVNPSAVKKHMRRIGFKYVTMIDIGNKKYFYCMVFQK
ncbi:MAG: class I SAM-dependent methyltransferase [Chloroflexi bacterium]|nr:class I SAM-dependent methyltransferase [Chloroflexota bacterium]